KTKVYSSGIVIVSLKTPECSLLNMVVEMWYLFSSDFKILFSTSTLLAKTELIITENSRGKKVFFMFIANAINFVAKIINFRLFAKIYLLLIFGLQKK